METWKERLNAEAGKYYLPLAAVDTCRIFYAGVEWCKNNPEWHQYPEEKPYELGKEYLTVDKFGCYEVNNYDEYKDEFAQVDVYYPGFKFGDTDVVAWMELPKYNYDKAET